MNLVFDPDPPYIEGDWLDPRTWGCELPYNSFCIDWDKKLFAIVDHEDYDWALQWVWHVTKSRTESNLYVTRNTRLQGKNGPQVKLYLHKEILKRSFKLPPTPNHIVGDHINGNSLDNRRKNLRWATFSENAENRWRCHRLKKQGIQP